MTPPRSPRQLVVPVSEAIEIAYAVLYRASGDPPSAQDIAGWLRDELRSLPLSSVTEMLESYLDQGFLQIDVMALTDRFPRPPMELLRAMGLGELEDRRLEAATHLVLIQAFDAPGMAPAGLVCARSAAYVAAAALGGVVFDPRCRRVVPIDFYDEPLNPEQPVVLAREVAVLLSIGRKGLGWGTTVGMRKFGLPELEVRDVPPGLCSQVPWFMYSVARRLLVRLSEYCEQAGGLISVFRMEPTLRVTFGDGMRANGGDEDATPPEGARGWTEVSISYSRGRGDRDDFLRIVAPRATRQSHGEWLYAALEDLRGGVDPTLRVKAESEAMAEAHRKALETLPDVARRFRLGLPVGHTLFVKHGFPVNDELREFMWIGVTEWAGGTVRGRLSNAPSSRRDLRAGQLVTIREDEVFDWMIVWPDGFVEGGFSQQVVQNEGEPDEGSPL